MRTLLLTIILMAFTGCGNAQVKTEKDMKQEIKKMEELIQEELGMVKTYPETCLLSAGKQDRMQTTCQGK